MVGAFCKWLKDVVEIRYVREVGFDFGVQMRLRYRQQWYPCFMSDPQTTQPAVGSRCWIAAIGSPCFVVYQAPSSKRVYHYTPGWSDNHWYGRNLSCLIPRRPIGILHRFDLDARPLR